jgi:hypothetical protein
VKEPLVSSTAESTTPAVESPVGPRPFADRLARQVLRINEADSRALLDLKGSLLLSAIRCVITYAIVPALAAVVTSIGALATPISLAVSVLAIGFAVRSLRRVWQANWDLRWAYTAFIAVIVAILVAVVVWDTRTLLG